MVSTIQQQRLRIPSQLNAFPNVSSVITSS